MADTPVAKTVDPTLGDPLIPDAPAPVVLTEAEKIAAAQAAEAEEAAAKEAAEAKRIADEQAAKEKAAADEQASKQKAAHVVLIKGGKPAKGIANSVGDDGTPIPRDGVFTIALVSTENPGTGNHPGTDVSCVARLPDKSEIGDVVEVYCVPGPNGTSALVHPPKKESIAHLPVSTGDNVGTCVEVSALAGRLFRKISATAWQVLGG